MADSSPYSYASPQQPQVELRKRNVYVTPESGRNGYTNGHYNAEKKVVSHKKLKKFDLFEKVETDFTVRTEKGGLVSLSAWIIIAILSLNEIWSHVSLNGSSKEHVSVDTSLGVDRLMNVNMNITFPQLSCSDLHVDIMDVAGDSHINLEAEEGHMLVKHRLKLDGARMSSSGEGEVVEANKAAKEEKKKDKIKDANLPDDYCGPCYGAAAENQCCQNCDDVIDAYQKRNWDSDQIIMHAEQCIREGKDKKPIKRMTKGEGCHLEGTIKLNKVAGNFHIAMGEAHDIQGHHIHQFMPDDAINFNSSHIIHELSFGKQYPGMVENGLNGVSKFVSDETGGTGVFQYFVKVVPTNFTDANGNVLETNRYSVTERYRPLMTELDDEHFELGKTPDAAGAKAGGETKGSHSHGHHMHQNAVLPGIFFIYEIYPFAVEVTQVSVPFTHLLIRLMAIIGGTLTISGWVDAYMYSREKQRY